MQIFPADIIMGSVLVMTSLTLLIGAYSWRGRREWPPAMMMVSGVIGMISPVIHILGNTVMEHPGTIPILIPLILWIIGILISISMWRKH